MSLLTFVFRLLLFSVQGFVKLAFVIKEEAEREMASPSRSGASSSTPSGRGRPVSKQLNPRTRLPLNSPGPAGRRGGTR